jgi:hypothetical protein
MALGAGTAGTAPNQQGALSLIARAPAGRAALVLICAGLLGYSVWKIVLAIRGHGPEGGGAPEPMDRVANLGGGIVYLVFFWVALRTATGGSGNASGQSKQAAAGVLGWPGGQLIVGLGGIVLIGISLYQLYDALRGKFAEDSKTGQMDKREHDTFMLLGRIGLSARALVFALVGYFILRIAIDFKATKAAGVNGALVRLQQQPLGAWLLGLVALGLLTFAAFSFLEGGYRRL